MPVARHGLRTAGQSAPRFALAAAYAACAWAMLFATANIYWGLDGHLAIPVVDLQAFLADPIFVAGNWLAVLLKAGLGLLALATSSRGASSFLAVWCSSVLTRPGMCMLLYGALGLIVDELRLMGVFAAPPSAWIALRWHVFLRDPWWIVGGMLFLLVARLAHRM